MSGEFTMVNDYLVHDLKKLGLWNDEMLSEIKQNEGSIQEITRIPEVIRHKYKETFEIDSKVFINLAAYRGKWIDQSQSLNLFYRGTSGKDIADMYMYAYDMGLKTTYYLRTLAASGIEKATTAIKKTDNNESPTVTPTPTEVVSVYSQPIPFNTSAAEPVSNSVAAPTPILTYSEVEHALATIKEKTREQAHTVDAYVLAKTSGGLAQTPTSAIPEYQVANSTGTGVATVKVNGQDVKICKILDPDCEACQ